MTILRYRPTSLLGELQHEMNRLFNYDSSAQGQHDDSTIATSQWVPAVDIQEDDKRFLIIADIPGVDPNDIKLHMDNGMLTIEGERHTEKEETNASYHRSERSRGVFYRRFSLPDSADEQGIAAKGKHGVLEISIPKKDKKANQRQIAIQSA